MVGEKEHIDELVEAYERGYDKGYNIGFLDGKDVGIQEEAEEKEREFVPQRWER